MGYRSEVQSIVYGSPEQIDALIVAWRHKGGLDLFAAFEGHLMHYVAPLGDTQFGWITLYGDSWKWYSAYPDVKAWSDFMDLAEEMGCQYEFVRVGEDLADIEVNRSVDALGLLNTYTEIIADIPANPNERSNSDA